MATECIIARAIKTNEEFECIYCHVAGYPEDIIRELTEYFDTPKKVGALIALGDITSVYEGVMEAYQGKVLRGQGGPNSKKFGSIPELKTYSRSKHLYLFMYMKWYHHDGKDWINVKQKKKPRKIKKLKYANFWNVDSIGY